MLFNKHLYSMGRPTEVVRDALQYLHQEMTPTETEQMARKIVDAIPDIVAEPSEWIWKGRILGDRNEEARVLLLEAVKPRHRWTRRIRLPRISN